MRFVTLPARVAGQGSDANSSRWPENWNNPMSKPKVPVVVNKHYQGMTLYIGRGSKWGNPFVIGKDGTREEVIAKYRQHLADSPELMDSLHELDGHWLGCFCKPKACHGDVLVEAFKRKHCGTQGYRKTPETNTK
jgi:hypothetical protein